MASRCSVLLCLHIFDEKNNSFNNITKREGIYKESTGTCAQGLTCIEISKKTFLGGNSYNIWLHEVKKLFRLCGHSHVVEFVDVYAGSSLCGGSGVG